MSGKTPILLSATALATILACAPRAIAADAAAAAEAGTTVGEVIVTAQKRQENINNVGMSIQAASGAELTKLGVADPGQLQKIVPGFYYTYNNTGTPVYSIRGVGFQDTSLAASPTVSLYVDEAPIPFSVMTAGASLDLERVEVLKGPQGTLFGENATGGAINYVAAKPTDTFHAGADVSYGRFNTADISGFVSGPITDTLDFRVALRTLQSDDWQKSYTHNATSGASDFLDGRGELLWRPTSRLKVMLTVTGYQDRGDTQMPQFFGVAKLNPVNPVAGGFDTYPLAPHNDQAADWGACVNVSAFNDRCVRAQKNNRLVMGTLRIDYELPNDMTLTSLTTHERFDQYSPFEGDGTTVQDWEALQTGSVNTTYQELRLSGRFAGRGNWIFGGNYEYDGTNDSFLETITDSSVQPLFGILSGPTLPTNREKTKTAAVFGNAEYPVTETLTLHAGARFTQSDKSYAGCAFDGGDGSWDQISQDIQNLLEYVYQSGVVGGGINRGPGGCGTTGPGPTFDSLPIYNETLNQNNVAWRAGADWKAIPGTLLYLNISQGWKAGAFPTVPASSYHQLVPVVQERLLAYEAGFKSTLLDHTLQINGAGFYYDYKNKQILGDLDDPVFGPLPSLVNVPKSHVVGFELSGVWAPLPGVTITPGVSYAHSRVDGDFVNYDPFGVKANFGGEAFPDAPEWQADVDAQYEWTLHDRLKAFVGLNVNYTSDTNAFFHDQDPTTQTYPPGTLDIPEHTLLDLRAGVEKDAWRVQLWGRNVTNVWYWTTAIHQNDALVRYTGMPATYGVSVSYRY